MILSLLEKNFENRKFSETKEVPSSKCIGTVRHKNLGQSRDSLRCLKTFQKPELFSNKEGFLFESYHFCATKSFRQNRDSLCFWKKFSEPNFLTNKDGFLYEFIGKIRQKVFDKVVIASRFEKNFQNQKVLKQGGILNETFRHCETWKLWTKSW